MNAPGLFDRWRTNFLTGLAVVLPALVSIAVCVWLFGTISNFTDRLLFFIPEKYLHANNGKGPILWYWSPIAFVVAVILVTVVGQIARFYFGKKMIEWSDRLLLRIPLLNKIYGTVKQVNDAFSNNKSSFKQVVLVPFPTSDTFAIGFLTSEQSFPSPTGDRLLTIFIPTTPNPTSGFLVLMPATKVTKLDIPVADGIKFIISIGSIPPDQAKAQLEALKRG